MWPGAENHIEICQEDLTKFTAEMGKIWTNFEFVTIRI